MGEPPSTFAFYILHLPLEVARMSATLGWGEIALRLLLTCLAGGVIGFNRGEHGRAAGLRTTLLVCLASSLSMILANVLLNTRGKTPDSFVNLDVMRRPLGILSGMGFIGAGTILRKDQLVIGVTTAATLWCVTMIGLCFGGGAYGLGVVSTLIAAGALWLLPYLEQRIHCEHRGTLRLVLTGKTHDDAALQSIIRTGHCRIVLWAHKHSAAEDREEIRCELEWKPRDHADVPPVVGLMLNDPRTVEVDWQPEPQSGGGH